MYEEGPTATVSVRRDQNTVSMAINGRTNASDSVYDMPTQVMLGQLPLLVAPKIDNGLIIGYATGVTVGAMLQSPVQSVTCVELEPGTLGLAVFQSRKQSTARRSPHDFNHRRCEDVFACDAKSIRHDCE